MDLFTTIVDFDQDVFRNICSLRTSQNLFDDLDEGDDELNKIAIAAEQRVKASIPSSKIERGFYYSTAISYPFEQDPPLISRYGNGSYPVWYAGTDMITSVYETAYHMARAESAVERFSEDERFILRERAVYDVRCAGLLIDLREKQHFYKELVAESYDFTHQIGAKIYTEGHPGLIAPSARYAKGSSVVIFDIVVLDNNPKLKCYLTYKFDGVRNEVQVERKPGEVWLAVRVTKDS